MKNLIIPIFIAILVFTLCNGVGEIRKANKISMVEKASLVKIIK